MRGKKDKETTKKYFKKWFGKTVKMIPDLTDELSERISSGIPTMLARLGGTEGSVVGQYCERELGLIKHYDTNTVNWLYTTSGFFADDYDDKEDAMDRYSRLTLDDLAECDYLSAMFPTKVYMPYLFKYYAVNATPTFTDFGPYFEIPTDKTWVRALAGKRVLVINSFTDSIAHQYSRKSEIVRSKEFELPDFELLTYKTVVTQVGERVGKYKNSFEVLEYMLGEIKKIDFDVALIGAGAYGFPIAAEIKRMGKIAMETCGNTPLFFGVYGERNLRQGCDKYMTDAWIRPMEEAPKEFKKVEDGCYW